MALTQPTTSNMAVRRGRWTPIVSTPQRDNADPNTIDYIKLFFEDFPGSIRTKAPRALTLLCVIWTEAHTPR